MEIIEQSLGVVHLKKRAVFNDLDYLVGTWNDKDKKEFDESIKSFENIDKEL